LAGSTLRSGRLRAYLRFSPLNSEQEQQRQE
jgi:hypothetical protein